MPVYTGMTLVPELNQFLNRPIGLIDGHVCVGIGPGNNVPLRVGG
jgi:hypothetical protein